MTKYTAVAAKEASIGQGVNGTGKRVWIKGAYTLSPNGKPCRAFNEREGGLSAAQKWAEHCNEHLLGRY
jgi:hypothetical protein